jgi:hypothetical protein
MFWSFVTNEYAQQKSTTEENKEIILTSTNFQAKEFFRRGELFLRRSKRCLRGVGGVLGNRCWFFEGNSG